jgi:hypothetical protein
MSEPFMSFTFTIADKVIRGDLGKELAIDTSSPEKIAEQLTDNSSLTFYWGSVAESAAVLSQKAEMEYELWWAPKYQQIKDELIDKYGKSALTETQIKSEIMIRYPEEYKTYSTEKMKANYRYKVLSSARAAFSHRHDALINLLAFYKTHMKQVG